MKSQDCWIKLTRNDGRIFVSEHRVWDKGLFVNSKIDYFRQCSDETQRGEVEEISQAEFKQLK